MAETKLNNDLLVTGTITAETGISGDLVGNVSGGHVNPKIPVIAGEKLVAGDLVYPFGYSNGYIVVKKAATTLAWFVVPDDIENTDQGYVVGMYELGEQDTSGGDVGNPVYLNAGGWTLSAPASGIIQQVGVVTAKSETAGKVLLMPFYSKGGTLPTP
jgi:hypothetical protein